MVGEPGETQEMSYGKFLNLVHLDRQEQFVCANSWAIARINFYRLFSETASVFRKSIAGILYVFYYYAIAKGKF